LKLCATTWVALAIAVLGLALYRKWIASRDDDSIHISGDGLVLEEQKVLSNKLEVIDRWGKTLTIVTVVFGLALMAAAVYIAWQQQPVFGQ